MDEIRTALKDAGWSDELIQSFVGRNIRRPAFPSTRIGNNNDIITTSSLHYTKSKDIGSPVIRYKAD